MCYITVEYSIAIMCWSRRIPLYRKFIHYFGTTYHPCGIVLHDGSVRLMRQYNIREDHAIAIMSYITVDKVLFSSNTTLSRLTLTLENTLLCGSVVCVLVFRRLQFRSRAGKVGCPHIYIYIYKVPGGDPHFTKITIYEKGGADAILENHGVKNII